MKTIIAVLLGFINLGLIHFHRNKIIGRRGDSRARGVRWHIVGDINRTLIPRKYLSACAVSGQNADY